MDSEDFNYINKQLDEIDAKLQHVETIVRKLHAAQVRGSIFKLIYFIVILALGIGFYALLRPVYESLQSIYTASSNANEEVGTRIDQIDPDQLNLLLELIR